MLCKVVIHALNHVVFCLSGGGLRIVVGLSRSHALSRSRRCFIFLVARRSSLLHVPLFECSQLQESATLFLGTLLCPAEGLHSAALILLNPVAIRLRHLSVRCRLLQPHGSTHNRQRRTGCQPYHLHKPADEFTQKGTFPLQVSCHRCPPLLEKHAFQSSGWPHPSRPIRFGKDPLLPVSSSLLGDLTTLDRRSYPRL